MLDVHDGFALSIAVVGLQGLLSFFLNSYDAVIHTKFCNILNIELKIIDLYVYVDGFS